MAPRGPKAAVAGSGNGGRPVPPAPSDLEAAGVAVWNAAWALPRIEPPDAGMVEQLARLRDEEARLRAAIAADGEIQRRPIQNSKGDVIATDAHLHPGLAMLRRCGREAAEIASELGCSPAGRRRLGLDVAPEPRERDWLDELQDEFRSRRDRNWAREDV